MAQQYFNSQGINTYINPLLQDGGLIHAVNVNTFPYGAKTKRSGYSTFLGTPDTAQVNSLFVFDKNNGTQLFLYRASGSSLYHSIQGTGAWTLSGNGTITNGAHFGRAVLDDTLIGGDGAGSTRHTTNGTSFTNTTLAPISEFFEQYQGRIYAAGTSSTLFYSTTNDATNWNTSGTSDSSSFTVPGAGKLGKIFKNSDKLVITKNSGLMYKWDGFSLIDMATRYGPSSPYSIGESEDYRFFVNQYGHYGYGGGKPQILSNAVQRQFYNDKNTGIAGTAFTTIPSVCHQYDYLASVGTITDDFTSRQIPNAIIKYDFQKNEYLNWSFANKPTALLSYKDINSVQQLIFGDASGQVYKMDTSTTDNGQAIEAEMVFVFTYGSPEYEKKWNWWRGIFNPGCQAKVQVACANTYTYSTLKWKELGDCSDGVCEYRFPSGSQSRLLFVRIYESSKTSKFAYYGCSIDAEIEVKR
jgi:hypothetical protein